MQGLENRPRTNGRLFQVEHWERLAKNARFQAGELAGMCAVSLRHLERFFGERHHKTPRVLLRQLQCRMARELISRGYKNKAIVTELGFASESHFCREFKKIHGASPQSFAPLPGENQHEVANGQDCRV